MKAWLIQRAEPSPHDNDGTQRLMRMGILAQMLADGGHRVVWWTSTFDHYNRRHRFETDVRRPAGPGYDIQYLRGCGYRRNASAARLRDNRLVARRFTALATQDPVPPDVILASLPTAELALAAVNYGRPRCIPVFLDVRDLWPDVFFGMIPLPLRPIARLLARPIERNTRLACSGADGILGITRPFVDWGLRHAGRAATDKDRAFPMGYMADDIPAASLDDSLRFWRANGVSDDRDRVVVVFFGTLGKGFDFAPVIECARRLQHTGAPVQFVICGAGENADDIGRRAAGLDNLVFPGWVNRNQIKALLRIADVGIAPYIARRDFIDSTPNKAAEYLSGGAPIALSLDTGELHSILEREDCGFTYAGDGARLAGELERLARDPARLAALQANALATFRKLFDASTVYGRMIRFLDQAASERRRPQPGRTET